MSFLIVLAALVFLMFVAYRGFSVILFAPVAALGAVLLTDPALVPPMFSGVFMDKMVGLRQALLPGLPAGRRVRQGDRAVRLLQIHRVVGDRARRARAGDAVDRGGLRAC